MSGDGDAAGLGEAAGEGDACGDCPATSAPAVVQRVTAKKAKRQGIIVNPL
jgi:hypothetical protein